MTSITKREFHPYADIFPLLIGAEFAELVTDIKKHGLRDPIAVAGKIGEPGKIIDGRNRYLACLEAKVEPQFGVWKFDNDEELLAWIISRNLRRRHLSESQRAMVAAKITNLDKGQRINESSDRPIGPSAKILNVGEKSVKRARRVLKSGAKPLIQAVENGDVSVSAAAAIVDLPKAEQRALVREGPQAVVDAARPVSTETQTLLKEVQRWIAQATPEDVAVIDAEVKKRLPKDPNNLTAGGRVMYWLPHAMPSDWKEAADWLAKKCPRTVKRALNLDDGLDAITGARPNQFGKPFAAVGSLLRDNGPSGKNGKPSHL